MTRAALALLALAAGCVAYTPQRADPLAQARDSPAPPPGPLGWEAAVRFALAHNPDLAALAAAAEAAGPRPPPAPPEWAAGADDEHRFAASLRLDALSLLGLGPRRAEAVLARARRREAEARHHARAREVAGELAEVYETERVLAALPPVPEPLDPSVYVRAGLLPAASEAAARADRLDAEAEREARRAARAGSRLRLRRLLGAPPGAAAEPEAPEGPFPPPAEGAAEAVLRARADVQLALAGFEVADAELRRAVARQFPGVALEPAVGGDPRVLFGSLSLRLPVGAGREARAAQAAREAALQRVRAAALDALEDAERAALDAGLAGARLAAARERAAAGEELFRAALARAAAEEGALGELPRAAAERVAAARALREAALAHARARVDAARAAGWPAG